ncbi:VOC family protein [Chitiniphilus purpureus]|uniref:VOC family protein n=1 Tax=Chitiniphilus purpureus TaxID=2981137 RepID=A0ABY6DWN3_9NEIS|nr:VOC family protein [Chitiniphilus sp. CD1]UXY16258.1 VOC family protein [Chitiniphilus sp. CD1]
MASTKGLHHLGLAVFNLADTTRFFVEGLGWTESGRDDSYPRTMVTDGHVKLTLWQVDHAQAVHEFNRRTNVGLHHLALEVESESRLFELAERLSQFPGARIEFAPELLGGGPRKHMMCYEPGGIRIEFTWNGQ